MVERLRSRWGKSVILRLSSLVLLAGLLLATPFAVSGAAGPLFEAALKDGDYGAGQAINTFGPDHGGSPGVLGIVDSPDGVTFTATEVVGTSNALINWEVGANAAFRSAGTISVCFTADGATHRSGAMIGENYGFNQFRNGQATFGTGVSRLGNGPGPEDDQVIIGFDSWHNNVWYPHGGPVLEQDTWYRLGFAWGGPDNDFEVWVDGTLGTSSNLPAGVSFPWGKSFPPSGFNIGLGDNHERGLSNYGTAAGVTYSDIRIWDQYVAAGDSAGACGPPAPSGPPAPAGPAPLPIPSLTPIGWVAMAGLVAALLGWRLRRTGVRRGR